MANKRKFIRFYIILGEDTCWKFTNQFDCSDDWRSKKYPLLFNVDKWTMVSIKREIDRLEMTILKANGYHDTTNFNEKCTIGAKYIQEFLDKFADKGVYTIKGDTIWGCKTKRQVENPIKYNMIDWTLDGKSYNPRNQFQNK